VSDRTTQPRLAVLISSSAAVACLLAGMTVATLSVVQYQLWIVKWYVALTVLLAWYVARRPHAASPLRTGAVVAAALAAVAVLDLKYRSYTYLTPDDAWTIRQALALTAVLAAAVFAARAVSARIPRAAARRLVPRHPLFAWTPEIALGIAVAGYVATAVALIHLDPAPRIDVWVTLQQAADAIARGDNFYAVEWTDSPGVQDAFTYLPFTALLLAPGRWLAGDVRWALVVVTLIAVVLIRALPGRRATITQRTAACGAAALLLLLPGTPTQVEQSWTEPLLLACLAGWALGVHRNRTALAVVCLALGLASKQHLAVLLPILAAWPQFGPRRSLAAAGLAGVFVLPWFVASPADLWHDTVTVLVNFQPLIFADTLFIAAINELNWTPPFWLTGMVAIGTVATAAIMVRRRNPDLPAVLRWCALVLLVANLVNKQAFYNQYWLVAALVLVSWAVPVRAAVTKPRAPRPVAAAA
jgi:hypothetical protein